MLAEVSGSMRCFEMNVPARALGLAIGLTWALSLTAQPAAAQNADQIAHVQAGASCPHCNLFQADFGNRVLKNRNLAGSRLRQADFSLSVLNGSKLTHTDLRDVNGYGALFTGVDFRQADMTNASMVGAYLQGANLRGARLKGANFSGAEMDRALGLSQRQLNAACGDSSTTLPKGLHLPACE
jgi:uncharacterized protein YjbI with pentapeptide repeats